MILWYRFLYIVSILFAHFFGGILYAGQTDIKAAFPNLSFNRPVDLQHAGDGTNRIFVVSQRGIIHVFENNPAVTDKTVFLDITEHVVDGGERGLLGLAFHPDYENNGYFYVNYTAPDPLRTVVSRFEVSGTDPDIADENSELIIIEYEQPYTNHNGGQIAFGPDGYLYIASGDGGGTGDPDENAQNRENLLGKILRIDVDNTTGALNYAIPDDNPFVGNTEGYREEIFAYGLRNPWRMSFDFETGRLWCGDVGQSAWEVIHIIENGKNYGWNIIEGSHCYPPGSVCDKTGLEMPVYEYEWGVDGRSITGGYVYRGSTFPDLSGKYIYGDYMFGTIWALEYDGENEPVNYDLIDTDMLISSFGVDEKGEIYILEYRSDGKIYTFTSIIEIGIRSGWNLIGLPLEVFDANYRSIFPDAIEGTLYEFDDGYQPRTDMDAGTGYWLRFPDSETAGVTGLPVNELTLDVTAGWNMISGLSRSVALSSVNDPKNIIIPGTLYEFDGSYQPSDELEPGKGYWLRVDDDGQLSMSAAGTDGGSALARSGIEGAERNDTELLQSFDRIEIRDAEGVEHTLYFGSILPEGVQRERYSLPPLPPAEAFDVRFTEGYYLSEENEATILLQGESYTLELTFHSTSPDEVVEYIVTENEGIEHRALSGESIELTEPDVRMIQVRRSGEGTERALPEQYSLSQNYPNPFNPMTTIQYALPKDSYVKLEIFNMLGQRVRVLVDEEQAAGYYEVVFDAGALPSGVYVYRIRAGEFVGVKRFVYLK